MVILLRMRADAGSTDPMYALSLDVLAVVSLTGKVVRVNPAATTISGWQPGEVIGRSFLELVHPEDRSIGIEALARMTAGGTVENLEIRMLCKDSSTKWMSWSAQARVEAGRFYAVGRDITESRSTQASLREKTEELTERVRHLDTLYAISLCLGRRQAQLRELLAEVASLIQEGLGSESLVGVRVEVRGEMVTSDSFRETGNRLEARVRSIGRIELFHRELSEAPGAAEIRFIEAVATHVAEMLERNSAEERLLRSEARFRSMSEASPLGIFMVDREGDCIYTNARCRTLWGLGFQGSSGRNWLRAVDPDTRDELRRNWDEAIRKGRPFSQVCRFVRAGNKAIWASVRTHPVLEDGLIVGYMGMVEDISEQRELEHQLRHSQKMEAFGKLAGGVAHDFNNILTVISGFNEMLMNECAVGDPRREFAEEVQKAADRASALTRQLLAFSRQQVLQPKLLEINEVITNVDKMLRRLIGEDVELRTVPAKGLRRVKADPDQLAQVLINLAVNARDAMPNGGELVIETDRAEAEPDGTGSQVVIKVRDNGIGMSEEVQNQVFEPFFTTKPPGQGTGLGLATCYGIVKQSGGSLELTSRVGEGTEFRVFLPEYDEECEEAEESAVLIDDGMPCGGEHILVVEDEPAVRLLAVSVLTRCGYQVTEASDGADAIERLCEIKNGEMDLVITDVVMPHMGGRDLAYWVASSHPSAKVLFTSGYPEKDLEGSDVSGRFAGFMPKPYRAETLARTVRQVLDGNGHGNSGAVGRIRTGAVQLPN